MGPDITNKNDHYYCASEPRREALPTQSDAYNLSTIPDEAPAIDLRTSNYSAATGRPGSIYMDALTGLEADEEN